MIQPFFIFAGHRRLSTGTAARIDFRSGRLTAPVLGRCPSGADVSGFGRHRFRTAGRASRALPDFVTQGVLRFLRAAARSDPGINLSCDIESALEILDLLSRHGLHTLLVFISSFHNEHIFFPGVTGVMAAARRASGCFHGPTASCRIGRVRIRDTSTIWRNSRRTRGRTT